MKRTSLLGFVGLLASVLAGCPIYSGNGNSGTQSSTGTPFGCASSADCGINETCGSDGQCHSGDCTLWGCSAGFSCEIDPETRTASCQPGDSTTSTGSAGGSGGSGGGTSSTSTASTSTASTGGGATIYCGKPDDCAAGTTCAPNGTCRSGDCAATGCIFGYTCQSNGTCASNSANACDKDSDCASGELCIAGPKGGGVCTKPADQCFDQSQCDAGDKCVAGKCTQACAADTDCRDGFACDTALGICSKPVKTCTITNDCGGPSSVCVGGACVPRATAGTCAKSGDVWTENGCIPNQAATFTCVVDGAQDACNSGSVCLHHVCWISCDAPNQTVCNNLVGINQCKPVDSTSGAHNVCGSSTNLGSDCGAGAGNKTCTGGKICIDGFCK